MNPLVSVVIQSYNSMRYIEKCLDSLLAQNYPNIEVIIIINGSTDRSATFIKTKYGRNKKIRMIEPGENTFYSRGNNIGIRESHGEYIFALNQDTVLEQGFIKKLIAVLEADQTLSSVSGKLLHYNYTIDSKTKIIDSTGIEIFKTRRVIDRGQWERDEYQYDADREIFGASGAAAMYRRSALEAVKLPKKDPSASSGQAGFEYFDESFVAYKEDIDLSWRFQLAGFRCRYVPEAVLYHGRSVGRSWPNQFIRFIVNRSRQSRIIRKNAFKNHYLMMVKCEVTKQFWRQFGFIFVREFLLLVYTVIFEPFQIATIPDLWREVPEAWRKRKLIMSNLHTDPDRLQKLFH